MTQASQNRALQKQILQNRALQSRALQSRALQSRACIESKFQGYALNLTAMRIAVHETDIFNTKKCLVY